MTSAMSINTHGQTNCNSKRKKESVQIHIVTAYLGSNKLLIVNSHQSVAYSFLLTHFLLYLKKIIVYCTYTHNALFGERKINQKC